MPEKRVQRKMVNIDVNETSGVDHPAHLHEGWIVRKGVSAEAVADLFGTPIKKEEETVVPKIELDPTNSEDLQKAKLVTQDAYDKVKEERDALKTELAAAKKAPAKKSAEEEALEKAAELPEHVQEALRKSAADQEALREELQKERDERLDEKAIAKSKSEFSSLAFDHETVAPGLRKMAIIDPTLATTVESVLKAADAQLNEAGLFATFGKSQDRDDSSAVSKLEAAITKQLEANPTFNRSQAMTKAVELDPALYNELEAEGK